MFEINWTDIASSGTYIIIGGVASVLSLLVFAYSLVRKTILSGVADLRRELAESRHQLIGYELAVKERDAKIKALEEGAPEHTLQRIKALYMAGDIKLAKRISHAFIKDVTPALREALILLSNDTIITDTPAAINYLKALYHLSPDAIVEQLLREATAYAALQSNPEHELYLNELADLFNKDVDLPHLQIHINRLLQDQNWFLAEALLRKYIRVASADVNQLGSLFWGNFCLATCLMNRGVKEDAVRLLLDSQEHMYDVVDYERLSNDEELKAFYDWGTRFSEAIRKLSSTLGEEHLVLSYLISNLTFAHIPFLHSLGEEGEAIQISIAETLLHDEPPNLEQIVHQLEKLHILCIQSDLPIKAENILDEYITPLKHCMQTKSAARTNPPEARRAVVQICGGCGHRREACAC